MSTAEVGMKSGFHECQSVAVFTKHCSPHSCPWPAYCSKAE